MEIVTVRDGRGKITSSYAVRILKSGMVYEIESVEYGGKVRLSRKAWPGIQQAIERLERDRLQEAEEKNQLDALFDPDN